jgi:nicotinamidase-related amidase
MATTVDTTLAAETYAEIVRQPLAADKTFLLVCDIQEKIAAPAFERERLIRNSQILIRLATILKLPVLVSLQYPERLGVTVPEIASLLPEHKVIEKMEFGCFGNERFCSTVRSLPSARNTMLVCGLESHICVWQTVAGALTMGYLVHVAADAVSSRAESNWKIGLERMRAAGAVISSTEMMIYELLRTSSGPAFKEMLQYLK